MKTTALASALALALTASSCNIYDFMDNPSGDEQILSAARACMNKADFACAKDQYAKIASANDTTIAESVYAEFAAAGASFGAFIVAFGKTSEAKGISLTKLSNSMAGSAGLATRKTLLKKFKTIQNINHAETQALARFIAGLALAAELLAEDAGSDHTLTSADLASNPTTCAAQAVGSCTDSSCDLPSGKQLVLGSAVDLDALTDAEIDALTAPTYKMVEAAFTEANNALSTLGREGGLGAASSTFINAILEQLGSAGVNCFRYYLLDNSIGSSS